MTQDHPVARRLSRMSLEHAVRIELKRWSALVELYTRDIRHDGVFIRSTSAPAVHTKVAVHLHLPEATATLRFWGEVVHVIDAGAGAGFGVHLQGLSDEDRQLLQQIVEQAQRSARTPEAIGPVVRRLVSQRIASRAQPPPSRPRRHGTAEHTAVLGGGLGSERAIPRRRPRRHTTAERVAVRPRRHTTAERAATRVPAGGERAAPRRSRRRTTTERPAMPDPGVSSEPIPPSSAGVGRELSARARHRQIYSLALEMTRGKRYREASELLSRAHALVPEHLETQVLRSLVLARQAVADRDLPRARSCYEDVLRLEPDNAIAHKDLLILSALVSAQAGPATRDRDGR